MIPDTIFQHVMKTLNVLMFRPVVMLCGDAGQQQPFYRQMSKIMQIKSAFDNTCFNINTYHYHLIGQHRVGDPHYLSFFTTIRKWIPTQQLLGQIQHGRVLTKDDNITDQVIYDDLPIYSGMRVVIAQNRDKRNGVVNGHLATIHTVHNHLELLKLTNGKIVAVTQ